MDSSSKVLQSVVGNGTSGYSIAVTLNLNNQVKLRKIILNSTISFISFNVTTLLM